MRFLVNTFLKYRDSFALAFFFAGVPFVYFLRDGLKMAPDNMIFSIIGIFLPFAIALPFKDHRKMFIPNRVTFPLLCWFIIYLFAYFYLKERAYFTVNMIREIQYFVIIAFVGFALVFIPDDALDNKFIYIGLVFTVISGLALVYYVAKNPFFVMGQRATFSYGSEGGGNPHINSKGAYFGIIFSVLALKHYKKVKLGLIIPSAVILLCMVILFLTQTILAFLATFLFIGAFFVFNLSFSNAISTFKLFFSKWYVLAIIAVGVGYASYKINQNKKLLDPAFQYVENRFTGIKDSVLGIGKEKKAVVKETGDDSANTRVMHIEEVFNRFGEAIDEGKYQYVLFGQGYKYMYVDIPHLEMLDSFGLVGLVLYTVFFLRLILMCAREMRDPTSIGNEFLAYAFIYFFVSNFTAGQMLDYTRLTAFFVFCRYLKK